MGWRWTYGFYNCSVHFRVVLIILFIGAASWAKTDALPWLWFFQLEVSTNWLVALWVKHQIPAECRESLQDLGAV